MIKKAVFATFAVFIVWTSLDIVVHGVVLHEAYASHAEMWRSQADIKQGILAGVTFIAAASFVAVFALFCSEKSLKTGFLYGNIVGIGTGTAMAYGPYAVMPVAADMASIWFLGTFVESVVAGVVIGFLLRDERPTASRADESQTST